MNLNTGMSFGDHHLTFPGDSYTHLDLRSTVTGLPSVNIRCFIFAAGVIYHHHSIEK